MLATAILSVICMGLMVEITLYYAKRTSQLWKITQTSLSLSWMRGASDGDCLSEVKPNVRGSKKGIE